MSRRLGKYLQTKTMHRFRRDARAIRREHAERVKQQEEEQQKKVELGFGCNGAFPNLGI